MAVKNLILRGNTYFWRGRLPTGLDPKGERPHFTISLKTKDFDVAEKVARRMTFLKDELASTDPDFMTHDQLRELLAAERSRFTAKIDRIVDGAVWGKGVNLKEEVEADLVMGSVFRLIYEFGPQKKVVGSESLYFASLEKADVPSILHKRVLFFLGLEIKNWLYPTVHPYVLAGLKKSSLPANKMNVMQLSRSICKMRADVLLDLHKRYTGIDAAAILNELHVLSLNTNFAPAADISMPVAFYNDPNLDNLASFEQTRSLDPESITQAEHVNPTPVIDSSSSSKPPLQKKGNKTEIGQMVARAYRIWRSGRSSADLQNEGTKPNDSEGFRQFRQAGYLFERVLEQHGVLFIEDINQGHVTVFRELLSQIDRFWGRNIRKDTDYPTIAHLLSAAAKRKCDKSFVGLNDKTIRRQIGSLASIIELLIKSGIILPQLNIYALMPPKPSSAISEFSDSDYDFADSHQAPESAAKFTHLPLYTGCKGSEPKELATPGQDLFQTALYWAPLLLLFTGARRAEIAALDTADIKERDGIHYILIKRKTDGVKGRGLKNAQSRRVVPLHSEVIRLGFLRYVKAMQELNYTKLFPELLNPANSRADMGDVLYKQFTRVLKLSGSEHASAFQPRLFHRLRGVVNNHLKQVGVEEAIRCEILGHKKEGVNENNYSNVARLEVIQRVMEKIPALTAHLPKPTSIKLFPFVAANQPAPWFQIKEC